MTTTVAPRAALRSAASPRLRMKNAAAAIEFYKHAFGARELLRFPPEGRIAHAELLNPARGRKLRQEFAAFTGFITDSEQDQVGSGRDADAAFAECVNRRTVDCATAGADAFEHVTDYHTCWPKVV